MTRLDQRTYEGVLRVIHDVREVTDPDGFGPVVLRELARLLPSDVLSFNEVDPVGGRFSFVVEPTDYEVPPGSDQVLAARAHEHPLIQHVARTGDGSAQRISDFWTARQWHDSGLYRELYGPMGVEHQMSIALPAPRPIVVGVVLNRGTTDFSDRERTALNVVRPHLAQSWRHAREHARVRSLLGTASAALDTAHTGAIVLADPPHELTPGALVLLYRYFGRPGREDPMPPRVSRWLGAQRAAVHADAELNRPLVGRLDGRGLVLRFLPAAADRPEAILLTEEVAPRSTTDLAELGLTTREAEILREVATGASNADIAAHLHIAASTVKKHLDNIYTKLGVSGRGRAAAVVLEMLGHHDAG